jgi:hypothetical protein
MGATAALAYFEPPDRHAEADEVPLIEAIQYTSCLCCCAMHQSMRKTRPAIAWPSSAFGWANSAFFDRYRPDQVG